MLTFQKTTLINASVETLWQFHERPDILQLLTPPWQPVEIVRREGGLGVGAITEFKLILGFIPIRWLAYHVECEEPYLFVDKQTEGPLKSWVHRHEFSPEENKTYLTDRINYELPGGWIAEILLGWWVNSRLEEMFKYRHQVTQRECEKAG